jgi:hypothetical protein
MNTIEIDFDVFKKLTGMREAETTTYNDVLRRILSLSSSKATAQQTEAHATLNSWETKGVAFPAGTEFRASYKGKSIYGRVETGALVVNGKRFDSPSAAAVAVTGNPVNGWIFWECKQPGRSSWQIIKSLRKET